MDFGERIARLRKSAGLSQADLARIANITPQTIQNIEGSATPRMHVSTALVVGEALVDRGAMNRAEIFWYCRETGLKPEHLLRVLPMLDERDRPADPVAAEVRDRIERLLAQHGPDYVRGLLDALDALVTTKSMRTRDGSPTPSRTLTVHHPPVQVGDHMEKREVDYEVPPPPATKPVQKPAHHPQPRRRPASG